MTCKLVVAEAHVGCGRDHIGAVHGNESVLVRNVRNAKLEWLLLILN